MARIAAKEFHSAVNQGDRKKETPEKPASQGGKDTCFFGSDWKLGDSAIATSDVWESLRCRGEYGDWFWWSRPIPRAALPAASGL